MAVSMMMDEGDEERFEPGSSLTLYGDVVKRLFGDKPPELGSEFVADTAWRLTMASIDPPSVCLQLIAIAPETDKDTDLPSAIYGKDGPLQSEE